MVLTNKDFFKTFLLVAELKSVNKAAVLLHLSTSGVSRRLDAFEKDVGVPLFQRDAKGVRLTEAGQNLYQDLKAIDHSLVQAFERARRTDSGGERITLRFGISCWSTVEQVCMLFEKYPVLKDRFLPLYKPIDRLMTQTSQWDFICQPHMMLEPSSWGFYSLEERFPCLYYDPEMAVADSCIWNLPFDKIATFDLGVCPRLDDGINVWKENRPDLIIERYKEPFAMLNRSLMEGTPLFAPDFGGELHPRLKRIVMKDLMPIPHGLRYPKEKSAARTLFLTALEDAKKAE